MNLLEYKILVETEKAVTKSFIQVRDTPNKDWRLRDLEDDLRIARKNLVLLKDTYEDEKKEENK